MPEACPGRSSTWRWEVGPHLPCASPCVRSLRVACRATAARGRAAPSRRCRRALPPRSLRAAAIALAPPFSRVARYDPPRSHPPPQVWSELCSPGRAWWRVPSQVWPAGPGTTAPTGAHAPPSSLLPSAHPAQPQPSPEPLLSLCAALLRGRVLLSLAASHGRSPPSQVQVEQAVGARESATFSYSRLWRLT